MSDSPLRIVPPKLVHPDPIVDAPIPDGQRPAEAPLDELEELRRLLVEPEQLKIGNILERLNNPRVRARELSRPLPEAIRLRNAQDDALSEALTPTIVKAFQSSIKSDPKPVAEAISPLMGPAIRRAISVALSGMVQSFDQALKHSFSLQGLKWRIEALRTGKRFAEVVLLHTLLYRVEQVFLIHKQTGLLLQHVAADATLTQDADIVSGMLTAIQVAIGNFARDSFGGSGRQGEDQIDSLDMGDREVWFETGPSAVLAIVINGQATETLRGDVFAPALEAIQIEQRDDLAAFNGDSAAFENSRRHLEGCLQSQYRDRNDQAEFKIPASIWLLATAIVLALGAWGFFAVRGQWRWNAYLERLKNEPGIVVAETGKQDGKRFVAGLRDPLAADPGAILRDETPIDPSTVAAHWEPYQALEPRFVLARAQKILEPPATVELKLDNGTLKASGVAPHAWIAESRGIARALAGITAYDDQNLIDEDLKGPEMLRQQIQQQVIRFITGSTQIAPGQTQALQALLSDVQKLFALAPTVSRRVRVEIVGHTDTEGDDSINQRLSQERANKILSMFISKQINPDSLTVTGVGSAQPVQAETSEAGKQLNRSVSFNVSLFDPRRAKTQSPQANSKEERR
ncbi:MAG: OmpA family protein [Acidobacteriota bacterium]